MLIAAVYKKVQLTNVVTTFKHEVSVWTYTNTNFEYIGRSKSSAGIHPCFFRENQGVKTQPCVLHFKTLYILLNNNEFVFFFSYT